jgi:hypothetical protein
VYRLQKARRAKIQLGGEKAYRETVLEQAGYVDRESSSSKRSRRESNREFKR